MIYVTDSTTNIYPNLFERGEALSSTTEYTIEVEGIETTVTYTTSSQASPITERYFELPLPSLTNAIDGYYTLRVLDGETVLYTESLFIDKNASVTRYQNEITNTYYTNG